jgi:hypothetical protein
MAINYTTLRTEVETAPYAAWRANGDDTSILAYLNSPNRAGTSITVSVMDFNSFMKAMINFLSTLSTAQGTQMQLLGLGGSIYLSDTLTRAYLEGVYSTTAQKTQLQALYTRLGSRAEALFGENVTLSMDDLVAARSLLQPGTTGW